MKPKAIGIVRVSRVGGRSGERFLSPEIQRERIEAECANRGLEVIDILDEMDTSGGKSLAKRPELTEALSAVEKGNVHAIVFAYRDRMDRSITTGSELCERMDAAGGLLIADGNVITHATHDGWRRSTFESFLNEDQRRAVGEKMQAVQERCVAEGRPPWSRVALGLQRQEDGTLSPDPKTVPIVQSAFKMRADGASMAQIREMLKSHGVKRSHRGVQVMLANRIYLGELHFGKLVNPAACEPIIDRELWDRVQRMIVPRGPSPASERLLSRLGVLRCGTCGARLSAMKLPKQNNYPIYRCPSTSDCDHHMTISAEIAEKVACEAVEYRLAHREGHTSVEIRRRTAARERDEAQQKLETAIRTLAGIDEPAARETIEGLHEDRDLKQTRLDGFGDPGDALANISVADFHAVPLDKKRLYIRTIIESMTVGLGRGPERIVVKER